MPLVEAAALLHAKKEKGVTHKLHAAVSGIEIAALGSDAEDSEVGSDEASVGHEDSDASLEAEEGEELYDSSNEAGGVVLEGGMGVELRSETTQDELRMLGLI
jgi:hypothetical protein